MWSFYYIRWWFIRNLLKASLQILGPLLEDTAIFNWWLRAMGMKIGSRVLINTKFIGEPSLIEIGDDVRLELNCVLLPHCIESGCLVLRKITIGSGTIVRPRAFLTCGSVLQPDTEVGPLSSTGSGSVVMKPTSRRVTVYTQVGCGCPAPRQLLLLHPSPAGTTASSSLSSDWRPSATPLASVHIPASASTRPSRPCAVSPRSRADGLCPPSPPISVAGTFHGGRTGPGHFSDCR